MRLPSFQTRPTMRRIWSEMFLRPENNTVWRLWQLSIIHISRIIMILTVKTTAKSRGTSATTQRNKYHAKYNIYNRANSGMQSLDSLRDSRNMHCKIRTALARCVCIKMCCYMHRIRVGRYSQRLFGCLRQWSQCLRLAKKNFRIFVWFPFFMLPDFLLINKKLCKTNRAKSP